jgi:hypothetical protein
MVHDVRTRVCPCYGLAARMGLDCHRLLEFLNANYGHEVIVDESPGLQGVQLCADLDCCGDSARQTHLTMIEVSAISSNDSKGIESCLCW